MPSPNAPKEGVSSAGDSAPLRFWIISVMILFVLAKLLEWLHSFELTMPVFIAGGVLLAIASNYDKRSIFPFWPVSASTPQPDTEGSIRSATGNSAIPAGTSETVEMNWQAVTPSDAEVTEPQLPPLNN